MLFVLTGDVEDIDRNNLIIILIENFLDERNVFLMDALIGVNNKNPVTSGLGNGEITMLGKIPLPGLVKYPGAVRFGDLNRTIG